jgi:RNA polymerase sigma factor (sigma-70 family)
VKYQETVKIIVKKYIQSGLFKAIEFEDIVQDINAALLAKIPAMQSQYNGKSLFRTYFSVIVRNICLKEYRRSWKDGGIIHEEVRSVFEESPVEKKDVFEQEVRRFKTILSLYDKQRPKLLLCLKLFYKIPISSEDIRLWYPGCDDEDHALLMQYFGSSYHQMSDLDIYRTVTPIMNKNEGKSNSVDALRKWTDSKVHEIIQVLNGNPKKANYGAETLKILVDDFFSPFLLEK